MEPFFRPKTIQLQEQVVFAEQLFQLLKSGVPLLKSLEILYRSGDGSFSLKHKLVLLQKSIGAGVSFSLAIGKLSIFSGLELNLIDIGEKTGNLDIALQQVLHNLKLKQMIYKRIRSSLSYPLLVLAISGLLLVYLMTSVVPTFVDIFKSLDADLPLITQYLIGFSQNFVWIIGLIFIPLGMLLLGVTILYKTSLKYKYSVHRWCYKVPVITNIFSVLYQAHWSQQVGSLLASGMPLSEALAISSKKIGNLFFENACQIIFKDIEVGKSLSEALQHVKNLYPDPLFSGYMLQMVCIAEETGTLDQTFLQIAHIARQQFENKMDTILKILEPSLMLLLGLVIGVVVLALYMPIFQMGRSL